MSLFNRIPSNIRVPFWYAEINPGQNPVQFQSRVLMIGQKKGGSQPANTPVLLNYNADALFGADSMITDMYKVGLLNAGVQEVHAIGLEDDDAGQFAEGTITVSQAPSINGTLVLYVGGARYRVGVTTTDTVTEIRDAIKAAIDDDATAFVTTADLNTDGITLTAKHKGECGNTIRIETGLLIDDGPTADEILTIVQLSGGTANPDITPALAAMGAELYDFIVMPYADAANLNAIAQFLNHETGRWSHNQMLYGVCITAKEGTLAELDTFGATLNDDHAAIMGVHNSPSPIWRWAAAAGTIAADHLGDPGDTAEISRPLQTLNMNGVIAPKAKTDRWDTNNLNTLYYSGIAGYHTERDGTVSIDRMVTTYQTSEWGSPDTTWLDLNTPCQIQYFTRFMRASIEQKHGRKALADSNPSANPGIATAEDVKETAQFAYEDLVDRGVVENPDAFYEYLTVERDATDPSRLNMFIPPDVVNQLRIVAANVTVYTQYPAQGASAS